MNRLRVLATSDLGATTVALPASHGLGGTCAGVVELLERERGPAVWLDAGDLVVGNPSYPVLGVRPWADVAELPIAAACAGNHEFDDGFDAFAAAAERLPVPSAVREPRRRPGAGDRDRDGGRPAGRDRHRAPAHA